MTEAKKWRETSRAELLAIQTLRSAVYVRPHFEAVEIPESSTQFLVYEGMRFSQGLGILQRRKRVAQIINAANPLLPFDLHRRSKQAEPLPRYRRPPSRRQSSTYRSVGNFKVSKAKEEVRK